jgi:ribose transport system substrate-binding protein
VLALVAGLAWVVTGCKDEGSGGASAGKPRIALVMKARTNPFFARMEAGARAAAEKLGAELTVLAIDKETDAEKQAAHVETAISQGVQAILIAPADSRAIITPLLQAQREGIVIVNLDNRIDPQEAANAGLKIATFVGPDNEEGARKSTAALIEKIGGEGEVALLEGIRGVDNAEARKRGFFKAVETTQGKVKVVAQDTADWASEPAQGKMEGFLVSHPMLDGVFCANDMMALGAIAAIKSAGKAGQIVVTAYDNIAAAQDAMRAGDLYATIEQHPHMMGERGVEYALKALKGESVPAQVPVPTDLITRADLK